MAAVVMYAGGKWISRVVGGGHDFAQYIPLCITDLPRPFSVASDPASDYSSVPIILEILTVLKKDCDIRVNYLLYW